MYKEWTFLRPTFDSKRWQKLIFVAVITFRHKKIGTQTIKGNKIYWISHKSCRTCCHKYIKATRYCSHSYNIINNYQTWVVLLILHLKLNLEQSKHYTPQCPSGPQLNFLIFFVIVIVFRMIIPLIYRPKKAFSVLDHERF